MTTATTGEQPINARWKASSDAMVKAFGKPRVEVMLEPLIPLRYDGETLILGAPSGWLRDYVGRQLGKRVEKILGCPIRIEVSDIARKAEARRKAGTAGNGSFPAQNECGAAAQ